MLFLSLLLTQNSIQNHPDFALWHLMVSLQLVAMTAIPLSITAIVSSGWTIPALATLVSTVLSFIVSVAHLLQPTTVNKDTTSSCQRRAGIKVLQLLKVHGHIPWAFAHTCIQLFHNAEVWTLF